MPLFAKFFLALPPTSLTALYIVAFRSRELPRFDLDLLASWINGRSFQAAQRFMHLKGRQLTHAR
jgi:hypothetical protein